MAHMMHSAPPASAHAYKQASHHLECRPLQQRCNPYQPHFPLEHSCGDCVRMTAAHPFAIPAQVSKGRGSAAGGHLPSRLGRSQPGSPTAAYASATGLCPPVDTRQLRDSSVTMSLGSLPGLASAAGGNSVLQTQLRQQQQSRVSLSSHTSTTPAGLMISPGVAALANKYATSSVGGSSVGALSLPEQPSTGVW